MPKRRASLWNVTLGLAAIAIGAFVLFDVLDLDGSQLRAQSAESVLAESDSAETGRLCSAQPVPHALGPSLLPPSPSTAPDTPRLSTLLRRTRAVRSATLARARLTTPTSGTDATTDPV